MVDTKERMSRSNIYSIFGKLMGHQIDSNEDGEVLLKKAGLTSFWEMYGGKLSPYRYNRGYKNKNDSYNPEYACIAICEEIEEKQYVQLSNFLSVIGYELLTETEIGEEYNFETKNYSLVPSVEGAQQRNTDITYLRSMLVTHHSYLVVLHDEAITKFGSGQYVSCIENCRSLLENFFKKLDTVDNDYVKGILVATGETIIDNGAQLKSIKKIYTYWINNKKGANRFRLFQTMYSVMSGLGTHHEDVASKEDALLLLRYVEDCLLWCFRKGINC